MYEEIEVAIDDLLLDHQNPRLGTTGSQVATLRSLIQLSVRNFNTMMTSIKEHGLDPGDLFYLVDESEETGVEGYTVIDGNRRLGALKVLREPTLLAGINAPETVVKKLKAASDGFDRSGVGDTRTCVLFDNRGDAEDWILRRHGRNLEGEERISWGPLEIQRFQGDRSVLDILDFLERNGGYTSDEWATLRGKLDRRSYVLRRFLESKAGMAVLGIGSEKVDGKRLPTSTRNAAYLVRVLKRLVDDVASGVIDTRLYNKAPQIQEYFDDLPADMQPGDDKADSAEKTKFSELNIPSPPGKGVTKPTLPLPSTPTPKSTAIRQRDTLAPKQVEFKQPVNAKGQQFIREAMRVRLKDSPLSAAFILRGFIQFVVDSYMTDEGLPFWENERQLELHVRADRVIDHLIAAKRAKRGDLSGIRRRLAEKASKNPSSIQALNDYHHDQFQIPDADALRAGWDDATALFVAILGRPNK
jgi:hypothetical protein